MYKRAQEMFEIFWKKSNPNVRVGWDNLADTSKRGWWEVALAESRLIDQVENRYSIEEDRLKAEMATMVKRKHYTDAIKSLAACQNQIESLVVELRKYDPINQIAHDAAIVMDLLEAIIMANPDMQTEDWKADQKAKQGMREEKRRAAVQTKMWEGTVTADDKYGTGWEMAGEVAQAFNDHWKGRGTFRDRYKWSKDNVHGAVGSDYRP